MTDALLPTEVVLRDYPVRLGTAQQEHVDEVLREFQLLALSRPELGEQVPGRLLELVHLMSRRYGADLELPRRQREQAHRRGQDRIDLRYPLVPGAADVVRSWRDVMLEVDEFCRQGSLLALATPPDLVALRTWVVEEFLRQAEGLPPRPWSGPVS